MRTRLGTYTKWAIAVAVVGLALWTSATVVWGLKGDTVSEHVRDYAAQIPLIPLALGVLLGHWFWAMRPPMRRGPDGEQLTCSRCAAHCPESL